VDISKWDKVELFIPYELVNLHKAHSFKSGSTTLTGNGQTVYVMDDAMHNNHDSFSGKL